MYAAEEKRQNTEGFAVHAALNLCVAPIITGTPFDKSAAHYKLPEFTPEQRAKFKADKVYAIPPQVGNLLLMISDKGACQIAVRELDYKRFWGAIEEGFGAKTPFQKVEEKEVDGITEKSYAAVLQGKKIALFVSAARKALPDGGQQALITLAHIK